MTPTNTYLCLCKHHCISLEECRGLLSCIGSFPSPSESLFFVLVSFQGSICLKYTFLVCNMILYVLQIPLNQATGGPILGSSVLLFNKNKYGALVFF